MIIGSDLLFIKEWAVYLKRRQITNIELVLTHNPNNCHELAFVFQVVVQMQILRVMRGKQKAFVSHPIHLFLSACLQQKTVIDLFDRALVQRVLNIFVNLYIKNKHNRRDTKSLCLIAQILSQIDGYSVLDDKDNVFQQLKLVGKWGYFLKQKSSKEWTDVLFQLKKWESVRMLFGEEWHQQLMDLVISWAIQLQIAQAQVTMDTFTQFQQQQSLIKKWAEMRPKVLFANINQIKLKHQSNEQRLYESKAIAKLCGLKSCRFKKQILKKVKDIILSFFTHKQMHKQLCQVFIVLFSQLQIISKESTEQFASVLTVEDLVENQMIFYHTLWTLQQMGLLQCFSSFSGFMRSYSVQSVLQINRKVVSQLIYPQKRLESLEKSIQSKDMSLLFEFNYCPVALSRSVLITYLNKSGIKIPTASSSRLLAPRRRPVLKNVVFDPLHFLLIKSCFWDDLFDRDVLELSLWITLDVYVKWLQQVKPKEVPDKQLAEYIFLLQLKYPTKLLQYHPIQNDIIKDLIIQPIFPTIVLKNKFFFSSYQRNQGHLQRRTDSGLQSWALPWSHLLSSPKSMLHYLHFDRGYQLALAITSHYRTSFERMFGDFFVFRITAELQALGISVSGMDKEASRKINLIDPQHRRCMLALLRQSQRCSQKVAQSAHRLLEILQ